MKNTDCCAYPLNPRPVPGGRIALGLFAILAFALPAFAQSHSTAGPYGHLVPCPCESGPATCGCKNWNVSWGDPNPFDGVNGRSRDEVQQQAKNYAARQKAFAEMYNRTFPRDPDPMNPNAWDKPSAPFCSGCQKAVSKEEEARDEARRFSDEWARQIVENARVLDEIRRSYNQVMRIKRGEVVGKELLPYTRVGDILRDYGSVMQRALKQYRDLRERMRSGTHWRVGDVAARLQEFDRTRAQMGVAARQAGVSLRSIKATAPSSTRQIPSRAENASVRLKDQVVNSPFFPAGGKPTGKLELEWFYVGYYATVLERIDPKHVLSDGVAYWSSDVPHDDTYINIQHMLANELTAEQVHYVAGEFQAKIEEYEGYAIKIRNGDLPARPGTDGHYLKKAEALKRELERIERKDFLRYREKPNVKVKATGEPAYKVDPVLAKINNQVTALSKRSAQLPRSESVRREIALINKSASVRKPRLQQTRVVTRFRSEADATFPGFLKYDLEVERLQKLDAGRLQKLVDEGDAGAQTYLAYKYFAGRGVAQDYVEAVRLFRLAAAQGHVGAQLYLGILYEEGLGVAKDLSEAIRNYKLAAAQGYPPALKNLKRHGQSLP